MIAYLKPNGSNVDLMVTAKANNNATPNDIEIATGGNVTEFAVTRINHGIYQFLFFAYIQDNKVYFKCRKFTASESSVGCNSDPNNPDYTVSENPNDGQYSRVTPDISLRNGRPIISYRGICHISKWVQFSEGEDVLLSYTDYPILIRYKHKNQLGVEVWSSIVPYTSGGVEQKYPNIEGCKNGNAYVLNFKYNSQFRQLAYLETGPGYCNPGLYTATDAKLIRGSFFITSNQYSSPMLMKLTPSGLSYQISKATFTISNVPTGNITVTDNLNGKIREQNLDYNFNLGPIFVKNTNVSFPNPNETSITNQMEFSNTMVSAPFSLGPNDTLILGGNGFYNYVQGETFMQKRFAINLMRKSTQGIFMTLLSDSIGVTDTIEYEYLRGYVFDENEIPEVDSFYVQLLLDSTSLYQGDGYTVCNVYSPDEYIRGEGDNQGSHKRYVHFEKGKNQNNVSNIPKTYSLSQNYPNPFNPVTNIKYQIPENVKGQTSNVKLIVFDILGKEVATLVNEKKALGYYTVAFNGSNYASGVYFYRIQAGDFMQVKKMVLIK